MNTQIPDTTSMPDPMSITLYAEEIYENSSSFCVTEFVTHMKSYEFTAEGGDFLYIDGISRFSGFSGLMFCEHSGHLILLSDRAYYVDTGLSVGSKGSLMFSDSSGAIIGTLKGEDRNVLSYEGNDVEDIEWHQGDCFLSHEIINGVSRYADCDFESEPQQLPVPYNISEFSRNLGMESLLISDDGVFLSMQEYNINHYSDHSAFLWEYRDNKYDSIKREVGFTYRSNAGYSVSSSAVTCRGNLLFLERKIIVREEFGADQYLEFETRIKFVPQSTFENIASGDVVSGTEIIHIYHNDASVLSDNFEGIATQCLDEDFTYIYLISDNNQSPTQRSLFLEFKMDEGRVEQGLFECGVYDDMSEIAGCTENIYPFCADK